MIVRSGRLVGVGVGVRVGVGVGVRVGVGVGVRVGVGVGGGGVGVRVGVGVGGGGVGVGVAQELRQILPPPTIGQQDKVRIQPQEQQDWFSNPQVTPYPGHDSQSAPSM